MLTRRSLAAGIPAALVLGPAVARAQIETYTEEEIVREAAAFLNTAASTVAQAVEKVFRDQGRPVGYIRGEEGSGSWVIGVRYGAGLLFMKNGEQASVYWNGPSIGFDFGGNASKVFTLVYGMSTAGQVFRRFPGVEGSAYVVGGLGVTYVADAGITLAPIRAGVGLRGGANVGYLKFSRKRSYVPI
jgi:hypothetical protein